MTSLSFSVTCLLYVQQRFETKAGNKSSTQKMYSEKFDFWTRSESSVLVFSWMFQTNLTSLPCGIKIKQKILQVWFSSKSSLPSKVKCWRWGIWTEHIAMRTALVFLMKRVTVMALNGGLEVPLSLIQILYPGWAVCPKINYGTSQKSARFNNTHIIWFGFNQTIKKP